MAKSFALPIKEVSSRSRRLKVNSAPGKRAKRADLFRSDAFIEKHTALNKDPKDSAGGVKSCQAVAGADICKSGNRAIAEAYNHGYRLHEIAALLSVHYGTVSSRLKQIEQTK
jgi:hypothetical protein